MRVPKAVLCSVLSTLSLVACDTPFAPETGAIRVVLSTTGVDIDPDGYQFRIDDQPFQPVGPNGSVIIAGLNTGPRVVRLGELAGNCMISGSSSLNLTVVASDTIDAAFAVTCATNVGSVYVTLPAMFGEDWDSDGFQVSLDGDAPRPLAASAELFDDVPVGIHAVTLSGVAGNCVAAAPTINVNVAFGQTVWVQHTVGCSRRSGWLEVQVTTTGVDPDGDGYEVVTDDDRVGAVGVNGTVVLLNVREGSRSVLLRRVSPNCSVTGTNPRGAAVVYGAGTKISFEVACVAAARVRVSTTTTGVDVDPGFYVRVQGNDFDTGQDVPATGSVTFIGMGPGDHTVTIEGVAPNCDVSLASPNPRTVAVTNGNTAEVAFEVACAVAKQLTFVRSWTGGLDLFVAKSNGTSLSALTTNSLEEHDPAYSPDGSRIAFRKNDGNNTDIYVMNADGTNVTRLTTHAASDLNPEWSPDGTRIAFRSNRDGNDEIYVMDADGTNVMRLTNSPGFDAKPSWSPDGTRIAFMSDRSGTGQIYVMNADGSNVVRLTNSSGSDGLPAWSPDGTKIAFTRDVACDDYYSYCHNIFVMNPDGTGVVRFATRSHDSEPAWSPDSRWIAFETRYCDYYSCSEDGISAIKADGKGRTIVLTGQLYNPTWRP